MIEEIPEIKIETLRTFGTPIHQVQELGKPPQDARLWIQFSCNTDYAEISGTSRTKQDLRDVLRELLAMLEGE